MRKTIAVIAAGFLTLTLTACGGSSGSSTEPTPEDPRVDQVEARLQCENAIKNQLKSPGTAEFSSDRDNTYTEIADDGLQVNGWVDSENSFGAQVRGDWQCSVTPAIEEGKFMVSVDSFDQR